MATTKRRRSKTFRLMEGGKQFLVDDTVNQDELTYIETDLRGDDDAKSPSRSYDIENDLNTNSHPEEEEGYVVLDLHNNKDLMELDKTFLKMSEALSSQKNKLAAKWDLLGKHKSKDSNETYKMKMKHSLLIDLKHMIERIEKIGMIRGKKFEDLEKEQNEAIKKLSSVVDLEEEARISRNRAIEIQKETELEMKQIDSQREIITTELKKAEPDLIAARLAVEDINDRALNELISLKKPPSTVEKVLTVAVWIVNSVPEEEQLINSHNKPTIVSLKDSSSVSSEQSEILRSSSLGGSSRNRNNNRVRSGTIGSKSNSVRSNKLPISKSPKTPKGKTSKQSKQFKKNKLSKRGRAQSTGLGLSLDSSDIEELTKKTRSKTPMSSQFTQKANELALTPLSESTSEVKQRSKSKILMRSKNKKDRNTITTPKHKKSGSRIDKLKKQNYQKILKQSWNDTRVLLTRGNFKKKVLAFDPKKLPKKVCARLENEFLKLEDFTVLRANQASKVLGPLVKWIRSLVGYTQIWYKIEPLAKKVTQLELALDVKKLEVVRLKHISKESHEKVIKIRSEMLKMVGYNKIGELYFLT